MLFLHILGALLFPATIAAATNACYDSNVRSTPSADHRQVPWGSPSVHFSSLNGTTTTCCNSLDEIRDALDKIDDELLDLLNSRQVQAYLPLVLASFVEVTKAGPNTRSSDLQGAAYVREATRFKSTRDAVNAPERNEAVLKQAEQQALHIGAPVTVARAAMGAILNSSVAFEQCIFDNYSDDR